MFKLILKSFGLIITHIIASRLVSIPVGIALFGRWYVPVIFIFFMDLIQIPFYYYIYESPGKIKFIIVRLRLYRRLLKKYLHRFRIKPERNFHATLLKRAQHYGQWGVPFIAGTPFLGGGMWSGVLLSHLIKLEKKKSYVLLSCGSLASCIFLALGFGGIKLLILRLLEGLKGL